MPDCRRCGGFVSRDFARVFGDNRGEVHGCLACLSARTLVDGIAERYATAHRNATTHRKVTADPADGTGGSDTTGDTETERAPPSGPTAP